MRLRATSAAALILFASMGCAAQTGAAAETDLAAYFKEFPAGAFVLYDLNRLHEEMS